MYWWHSLLKRKIMGKIVDQIQTKFVKAEKEYKKITRTISCALKGSCIHFFVDIENKGLEYSMEKNELTFSSADYVSWIQRMASTIVSDWQRKKTALQSLKYTEESIGEIYETWSRRVEISGMLILQVCSIIIIIVEIQELIDYTLKRR